MLTLKRFIRKTISKISLSSKKSAAGIYLVRKPRQMKRVLFYFNDPQRFHLGDHFFIEPLVRLFRDNAVETAMIPLPQMQFYFQEMGINTPATFDPSLYDLIISRIEFYDLFKDLQTGLLILDTTDSSIDGPICNYFLDRVSVLLNIDNTHTSAKPYAPNSSFLPDGLDPDENYLILNNYLVSSRFLVTRRHQELLCNAARTLATKHGLRVIHTGTKSEKETDPLHYDFVDVDLRGKLSVKELFALTACENVRMNVSFDAFGMHLFLLYNKPSAILFRGRFLKRNRDYVLNCLNPPFQVTQEERNYLISYIGNI